MRLKPGVSIAGLRPELAIALHIAEAVYEDHGSELVITAGTDGTHSPGSLHYVGLAVDLRTTNVPSGRLDSIVNGLRDALGAEFDVVKESDHIHLEFQPKHL